VKSGKVSRREESKKRKRRGRVGGEEDMGSIGTWIVSFHEGEGTIVNGESHDRHVVCVEDSMDKSNAFPPESSKE
jgi:hypothetical protein